ncbi:MAG: hypothetical protein AAFQ15_01570 [Pseudomonadota bacterium]
MRTPLIFALSSLALAACDQIPSITPADSDTPPAAETTETVETEAQDVQELVLPERNVAETKTATIDWTAARRDFAARDTDDDVMAQVASGSSIAVPVLLPDTPVGVASTGGDDGLQFRPLADGYFAVLKGDVYDIVINGTDKLVARSDSDGPAPDSALNYEGTMTGAQVSFSRYGASYLVEFMCNDRETILDGTCINEADALAEVEKLLISGTQ